VESLGYYTRSAARATFSAYRSLPIRGRLAGGSAALTFVILCGFAAIVGVLTTRQVRSQFSDEMRSAVDQLAPHISVGINQQTHQTECTSPSLSAYATAEHAQIRIYDAGTGFPICANLGADNKPVTQPPFQLTSPGVSQQFGYRVVVREIDWSPVGRGFLLYARPLSDVDHTLERVRFFLLLGVLGGTVLALLAGLMVAQRAMRPVVELTEAAREIERTRDPSRRLPRPDAEDEVAELARTLEGMLGALDDARGETEAALARQRQFVADASHELRTPLTSVFANLELLAEELEGEQAETAQAALRSTRRMRRLVADLLLLARADGHRAPPHVPTDLAEVLVEVAGELEPVADRHELTVRPEPVVVRGARDELHRLVVNLIENAIRHTPPGTHIEARTEHREGLAVITVQDDGPGVSPELAERLFDRFVRGAGDHGQGSGLGLSIVRAVAESHGGTVVLEPPAGGHRGARFVVRLPASDASAGPPDGEYRPGASTTDDARGPIASVRRQVRRRVPGGRAIG
jgi:signal transduction histidine kinase